jgi:hypothetical protein
MSTRKGNGLVVKQGILSKPAGSIYNIVISKNGVIRIKSSKNTK